MNNKARKLLVVLACTFLAFSLIGCSLVGGRGGQGDSGNVAGPAENQGGTISGRVSRDGTVGYLALRLTSGNSIQAAVRADTQFDVEGAEVWLDGIKDGDKKKVLTDVFGKFTITGVPFGKPFRLLASMLPSAADPITGKKIPFMRHSDEIKLTFEEPTKTAPT